MQVSPAQFVRHIVQLLAEWTETFPYDFRDERVMAHVRELTQQCVAMEPGVRRYVLKNSSFGPEC